MFFHTQLNIAFNHVERFLSKHHMLGQPGQRYGVLMGRAVTGLNPQPPQYVRSIAQKAGLCIDQHRWGLAALGEYHSKKVLFFLFERTSESPKYIVKMTRASALNYRLENEYRALSMLHAKGIGHDETLPKAVFLGYHNDLALIGETIIDGVPFERRSKATADCPYAAAVITALCELGAASADHAAATPLHVAESLERLFDQFTQIYNLTPAHRNFLAAQIAAIGRSKHTFPLIFQHGDPGTWNIMVTQAGAIALLDWEAAEPQGMPLWDLFYFLHHYETWTSGVTGMRDLLTVSGKQSPTESPFSQLLIQATSRYCKQVGLSTDMVEPLFYTCWMHRALKEATRLASHEVEYGHYVSLLRRCIDQRRTPQLQRLFSQNDLLKHVHRSSEDAQS
jgi:hypothetical protein